MPFMKTLILLLETVLSIRSLTSCGIFKYLRHVAFTHGLEHSVLTCADYASRRQRLERQYQPPKMHRRIRAPGSPTFGDAQHPVRDMGSRLFPTARRSPRSPHGKASGSPKARIAI